MSRGPRSDARERGDMRRMWIWREDGRQQRGDRGVQSGGDLFSGDNPLSGKASNGVQRAGNVNITVKDEATESGYFIIIL